MSESSTEDLMLQSSYANLQLMYLSIEEKISDDSSLYEIANQIEYLREILLQAQFQLNCYRCHQKLLNNDNATMLNKKKSTIAKLSAIKSKISSDLVKKDETSKKLKTENRYLEEQCINFQAKLSNLSQLYKELTGFSQNLSLQNKKKDLELSKVLEASMSTRDKSLTRKTGSDQCESPLSIQNIESPKFSISSYFFGAFQKNTSFDDQKSSRAQISK